MSTELLWDLAEMGDTVGFGFCNYRVVIQSAPTLNYPLALIHLSKSSALPQEARLLD